MPLKIFLQLTINVISNVYMSFHELQKVQIVLPKMIVSHSTKSLFIKITLQPDFGYEGQSKKQSFDQMNLW